MNLRFFVLLLLVTVLASLAKSLPLDEAPTESALVLDSYQLDPKNTSDATCDPDTSSCIKTRAFSGLIGIANGFGYAAKAAIKSFVGVIKNIIGRQDDEKPIEIYVPPPPQDVGIIAVK
uniref:Uncharacterized protein LOC114330666 n=1 Tax=Diabrotica virgifera virgifera TaxID=50390 RepID=A0A6P7FSB1_DIAVI